MITSTDVLLYKALGALVYTE